MLVEPGLALVLLLALALGFGLATIRASSEAETVAEAEACDDDGEADPAWDGEPVAGGEDAAGEEVAAEGELAAEDEAAADGEPLAVGEGDAGVPLEGLLGLVLAAGEVDEPEGDGEGEGVGEFDGFGVGVGVGVGVGEGVLEAGSAWHVVSVFAFALALVEVPGLGEAAASRSAPACAFPGKPVSTPRARQLPASTLTAATRTCAVTRTCARRMKTVLPTLLVRVTFCSWWVRRRLGDGWVSVLISGAGLVMRRPILRITAGPPWRVGGPAYDVTIPALGSVPLSRAKFRAFGSKHAHSGRTAGKHAGEARRASRAGSAHDLGVSDEGQVRPGATMRQ